MILFAVYMVFVFIVFLAGLYVGKKWGTPFLKKEREYAIGIYTGDSPFRLTSPSYIVNPVLRPRDVTDVPAWFVADPFMVKENGLWYMFFEVMNANTNKGDIGLAVSQDGFRWKYKQIVLEESFHLSYPYVFKWNGDYYMVPESCQVYAVTLYKAVEFPTKWVIVKTLLNGNYFDSSLLYYDKRWWIFTSDRDDILHLFFSDDLMGCWQEHPKSPIIRGNGHIARPGGRILLSKNKVFRFTQDCEPKYGYQVRAFEITELTPERYTEQEVSDNPILKPTGKGWNAERMHHIDLHEIGTNQWQACVDGIGGSWKFRIR
jgi:hypothetical protein